MYTIPATVILETMLRLLYILLAILVVPSYIWAQEKQPRERREPRTQPSAEEKARERNPEPGSTQQKAIEESWLKELRGEPGGTTENATPPAQPGATETPAQPGAVFAGDPAPSFISLLLRFLVIVGIMGGGLYLFVRFFKRRAGILHPQEGPVEVLASVPLMPGKFLQIVDLAGQLLVLGVSEQGVRLVYEIDSSTTAERIRLWHQSRPRPSATSLLDMVQKSIKKGEFKFWGGERVKDRPDFLDLLNGEKTSEDVSPDRLKDLLRTQNRKIRRSTDTDEQSV